MALRLGQADSSLVLSTGVLRLDTQYLEGQSVGAQNAAVNLGIIYANSSLTTPLALTYTPTVDAWWDVYVHVGAVNKTNAAYDYAYVYQEISPLGPNSVTGKFIGITMQNSAGISANATRTGNHLWKVNANTTYTVTAKFNLSAGTWTYNCDPDRMWIYSKAWAR